MRELEDMRKAEVDRLRKENEALRQQPRLPRNAPEQLTAPVEPARPARAANTAGAATSAAPPLPPHDATDRLRTQAQRPAPPPSPRARRPQPRHRQPYAACAWACHCATAAAADGAISEPRPACSSDAPGAPMSAPPRTLGACARPSRGRQLRGPGQGVPRAAGSARERCRATAGTRHDFDTSTRSGCSPTVRRRRFGVGATCSPAISRRHGMPRRAGWQSGTRPSTTARPRSRSSSSCSTTTASSSWRAS